MSFLTAGIAVLRETGREMTAQEILQLALSRGLVSTTGKTPAATMTAQLYVHVRDHPDGPLRLIAETGTYRARRGTVRWAWRDTGA
jgi:hypothetical protein